MVKFDAANLERRFRASASARISAKGRKDSRYANDAGYWDGGRCNWGGSHNLQEDCHTLELLTQKITGLKNARKELDQCTSKEEFASVKSRLARQAQEAESDLQAKTRDNASIGGICIIWEEYVDFIEAELRPLRNELRRLKEEVGKEEYRYVEELKLLKLEQKQIEARMKENQKKAANEKDPAKKAALLQLIEEDGKRLEENLKRQKEIPVSNLRFEPDSYVSNFINKLISAVGDKDPNEGNGGGGGSGGRNKKKDDNDSDDDNNNGNNPDGDGNGGSKQPKKKRQEDNSNFFQDNQQIIIIAGIGLLVIFYFMNQKTEPSPPRNYPNYDF